jgi:LAGLIDADG endonuclease.
MSLDVKRIPPRIGYYLAGFADGEGSFNVSFRRRHDYKMPWKISLCFNVSQRDKVILALFKRYLKCGTLRHAKTGCGITRSTTSTP